MELISPFLLLGIAAFVGLLGGKFVEKIGLPEVVGLIVIGLILGESFLNILPQNKLGTFKPITDLALAFFGFFVGAELMLEKLSKFKNNILTILLFETLVTFGLVTSTIYLYSSSFSVAFLLGALAVSTAPAATADVLWEYKAEGSLTTTIFALIGLDDVIAILLFSIASSYAKSTFLNLTFSFFDAFKLFIHETGGAVLLGLLLGGLLVLISREMNRKRDLLVLAVGIVILCSGVSEYFGVSEVLSNLVLGFIFVNNCKKAQKSLEFVREITSPLFVLFFVLTGARLNIKLLPELGVVGLLYLLMRILGKTAGSTVGAKNSTASSEVQQNIGFCLYSQAGVTVGLATLFYQEITKLNPSMAVTALHILNTVIVTTLILLFFGPSATKYAIAKAGEINKRKVQIEE